MAEEGTIHFAYDLAPSEGEVTDRDTFAQISAWRSILFDLELIGQDRSRYEGFGFGNISVRDPDRPGEMIVTASQTGGNELMAPEDLVRVTHVNFDRFWVDASGRKPPSSETITHAAVYASDPRIAAVVHVHCPLIWHQAAELGLPATAQKVPYGTAQMMHAVHALLDGHQSRPLVFATQGHEDGIFACGASLRDATMPLLSLLARARARSL